jgi:hypothetical protein
MCRDDVSSETESILPSQYFGALGRGGLSSEQRLMLAVLVDTINVLQSWRSGGSASKRRNFAEAAHWVNLRGTTDLFSFDSVCDALEINAELLRSRLRGLTSRAVDSAPPPAALRLRLKELSRSPQLTPPRGQKRVCAPR